MKELFLSLYNNKIFYKLNILNKYCIIYSNKYYTKLDIIYIFKNIIKFSNFKIKKINVLNYKKRNLKKYYILFS